MRFAGFFITGILLVQLGTPLPVVGNYEKLMFIAGIASFFWVQGVITTLLSQYQKQDEKPVYLFNVFLLISLLSFAVVILLLLLRKPVQNILGGEVLPGYKWLCIYILFNAPCFITEGVYILHHKSKELTIYGLISTLGTVGSIIIPVAAGYSMEVALAVLAAWSVIRYIWLWNVLLQFAKFKIKVAYIKGHLNISLPLIITFIVAGSAEYIDGLLVTYFFDPSQFAIFRYGARELPLSILMANALSTALIPLIVNKPGVEGFALVKEESRKLMKLIFPVSMVLLLISHPLYAFFFNENFAGSAVIFNIYVLLAISRTLLPQSIIYAHNGSAALLRISLIEIIINVSASYLLMARFGLAGIAMGTIIAHFAEKVMMIYYVYSRHNVHPYQYIPFSWIRHVFLLLITYMITLLIY